MALTEVQGHGSDMRDPLVNKVDLESQKKLKRGSQYQKMKNPLIDLASNVCTFLFIAFIFIFALFHYFYHQYVIRDAHYVKPETEAYSVAKPRATDDLRYYVNLIGLDLKTFRVTTDDGFVITLHRLFDPSVNEEELNSRKPVLLVHGLMQSSSSFVTSGYKSLAYHLISNGFDVWLGNNRCGFEPEHVLYKKDDKRMWDWDLNEMARYDIPIMIKYLKSQKDGYSGKVSMMAHSQGTTQSVWLFSKQFDSGFHIDETIVDKCVLLAPAIYGGKLLNSKLFIKFMRFLPHSLFKGFFGNKAFMPILMTLRKKTYKMKSFGFTSYVVFSYLFDWNDYLWDKSIRGIHFTFSPVYVSVKLMSWWLRSEKGQGFEMGKPIIADPGPWFDTKTPDLLLVVGGKDDLVDGDKFIDRLQRLEPEMYGRWDVINVPEYSHLDVLWADNLIDRVGKKLVNFLKN